jgi:5-methylcytosine-specific restriction protein A
MRERSLYTGKRWAAFRRNKLSRDPSCEECMRKVPQRYVVATEVDHITPISAGGAAWDRGNVQSLCKSCHSRKTAKEMRLGGSRWRKREGGQDF